MAASRQVQTWCQKFENWCPTGSRLAKSGAQKCKNWCPTGSRREPDEIRTGSIDRQEPTPAPIFPFPDPPLPLFSFSAHQPCTNTPPLLHQNGKSSLKPNGVLQHMYRMIHEYGSKLKTCRNHKFKSMFSINHPIIGVPNPISTHTHIYIYINRIFSHWSKHKRYYGT